MSTTSDSIYLSNTVPVTIRVYLKQDPSVEVFVKTTETGVRAKLKSIRRDIYNQKFPRWAPFANAPQACKSDTTGWAIEFVN
jgi:hypothetical protein